MNAHHMRTADGRRRLTLLIPIEIWDALSREAQAQARSINWVGNTALRAWVMPDPAQSEEEATRVQEALDKPE